MARTGETPPGPAGSSFVRTGTAAETAVAIALAAVLSLVRVKLPHLVYGGSVSLHTLPILFLSLRRGPRAGILAGAAYGVVNFVMTPYFVHPVQLVLDYPAAFASLGLAGLAASAKSGPWTIAAAAAGASLARLGSHVLSGVVYFAHLAPEGTPVWKYSLLYNASYMVPETLIAAAAVPWLVRRVPA